jgi:hypothetical protein
MSELHDGKLYVSREHLAAAVKTRKLESHIGKDNRADRIRGWLAQAVNTGKAILLDPEGVEWMGPNERFIAIKRLQLLRTPQSQGDTRALLTAELEKEEAMGAVLTWASENEEPPRMGQPIVLRKEKRSQLRTARHRTWKQMEEGSMDATILMLVLAGKAYPEVDIKGQDWIDQAATVAIRRRWSTESEGELTNKARQCLTQMRERQTTETRDGNRGWETVLDIGEGWGSIGTAASQIQCATIGVDRAGVLYQGTLHGHIRARVQLDFALNTTSNLLRRIGKKAEITLNQVMAAWLSPECTLLSRANNMNTSRGCAHGPYAETDENKAAATPERLAQERALYQDCQKAVEEQLRALEEENMMFAIENPEGSHFWELESVTTRVERMESRNWKIHKIDQCAYGREAKKPTWILTNIPWTPKGITGTGRCKIGTCAGTLGNTPGTKGAGQHTQQTCANTAQKRTKMGLKGEYSVEAAKNRVETKLVQEILEAARTKWNQIKRQ